MTFFVRSAEGARSLFGSASCRPTSISSNNRWRYRHRATVLRGVTCRGADSASVVGSRGVTLPPTDSLCVRMSSPPLCRFHPWVPVAGGPCGSPDRACVGRSADVLRRARFPVMLVGPSVVREGASDVLLALAEQIRSPVAVIPGAGDAFPPNHRLFLSEYGFAGTGENPRIIDQSDVLIFVGVCRENAFTGRSLRGRLFESKTHIRIPGDCVVARELQGDVLIGGALAHALAALRLALWPSSPSPIRGKPALVTLDLAKGDGLRKTVQGAPMMAVGKGLP